MKKRMSKKLFGLGIGAAFIGGAGFGFGAGLASYSIYHRYQHFRNLMHMKGYLEEWDTDYYRDYYEQKRCLDGCPKQTHCEWGFCECDQDLVKAWGQCKKVQPGSPSGDRNSSSLNRNCRRTRECQTFDMNAVCTQGVCACRKDMKWNPKALECQIFLEVDCSKFDYTTPSSSLVKEAVDASEPKPKTRKDYAQEYGLSESDIPVSLFRSLAVGDLMRTLNEESDPSKLGQPEMTSIPKTRTETKSEAISSSIFRFIDMKRYKYVKIPKESLEEAFCRDIDAFNEAFAIDDAGRPIECPEIPTNTCAVLYDSETCSGGWTFSAEPGTQKRFLYFSADLKYRNDVDTIGVRSGCTFTGFTGSGFDGNRMVLTAGNSDRWVVIQKEEQVAQFHEDIESLQCICRT